MPPRAPNRKLPEAKNAKTATADRAQKWGRRNGQVVSHDVTAGEIVKNVRDEEPVTQSHRRIHSKTVGIHGQNDGEIAAGDRSAGHVIDEDLR